MRIETLFLRSKVARRIFLLFVISALIPVTLLAILSFKQVNNLISKQQYDQLRQLNKQYGLAVLDRLLLLKTQISWIAQYLHQEDLSENLIENNKFNLKTNQGFKQIGLITDTNQPTFLLENIGKLAAIIQTEQDYLKAIRLPTNSHYPSLA